MALAARSELGVRDLVRRMCDQIVHRGPDDEGVHGTDDAAIGMRRLSIIDLASGHQPIHNEDRSKWLVFNGEIYNYKELRAELEGAGHRFYTASDSEVIVHAYEEYGTRCFARLRGMFAIAIWDSNEKRLVLARDRFGKKPLFYVRLADGSLAFGSELKCLLVVPNWSRDLSPQAIQQFLTMGYISTPHSIFRDVRKLEPAHWLQWESGEVKTERYWSLGFGPKHDASHDELAERLLAEVDEAVRVRLVSDVPFGAFLSGGLDSSIVVALMARHLSQPVQTFTIGFREAEFDEREDARLVASHLGARHEELVVAPDAVELVDRLTWHLDEPFGDASAIPTFLVSQLAAQHVKMVLSGDGGDEMFGGYARYEKYLRLRAFRAKGFGVPRNTLRVLSRVIPGAAGRKLRWYDYRVSSRYPDDYLSGVALLTPAAAADLLAQETGHAPSDSEYGNIARHFRDDDSLEALDRIISGDINTYLLDDILVKVDRMSMACSLEARAPLLDHKLAEFAARLPVSAKLHDGTGKLLLRSIATKLLPAPTLSKQKQGFGVPLKDWFRGPLLPMISDVIASRRFRERGIFATSAVRELLNDHLSKRSDRSEALWLILCFEKWAERFIDCHNVAYKAA